MTLYMAVTADEYELPLLVEEQMYVFAKKLGIRQDTLSKELSLIKYGRYKNSGKNRGYRLRKVEVEDD